MVPAPQPSNSQPFPSHLKSHHHHPQTPWNFSDALFKRVQNYTSDKSFKLCEVLATDPDLQFILKYFEQQKPPGYSIKRIVCIHNPDHTQVFEGTLKNQEREAGNPVFAPKGKDEDPKADRARALSRWESQASQFSPVEIKNFSSRGTDSCTRAKVLPLWHGSTKEVCQSICWSGFTSFGKHHYFDENASKGNTKSTDKGYFGAGIYFTNSAQYAMMYSSGGNLLLSWVSMREPYPVVNDKPHPQKGSDMLKLEGRMHYQNYNAHFIPVASVRPHDPQCIEYYPCYKDQTPAWDEFVVFHTSQTLPRFWIELGTDFPKVVLSDLGTTGQLLSLLLSLLDKADIHQHVALAQTLQTKADILLDPAETTPLGAEDQRFLKLAKRLLPEGEKLSSATASMLLKMGEASLSTPVKSFLPSQSGASIAPEVLKTPAKSNLPAIAFGKELWAQYIGDVGEEPPLPADINAILESPCPFWPDKKVKETHLLILLPKMVNGKPFTLNFLEELVKHPKQGQATKYMHYLDAIKKEYGDKPLQNSYWILMTRDVIPISRAKSYDEQLEILKELSQKAKLPYEIPHLLEATTSILLEYFRTGNRLYSNNPWTFTRCQEPSIHHWPLVVGGFTGDGLIVINREFDRDPFGVSGLRKLNDHEVAQDYKKEATANTQTKVTLSIPHTAAAVKASPPSLSIASLAPVPSHVPANVPVLPKATVNPPLPSIAFGKEQWSEYFGDIGEEPPLPPDIHQILQSPCPFFPGKRVEETHLLTLIPETVNGKPLTLTNLEELVKHPKKDSVSIRSLWRQQSNLFWKMIKQEYGNTAHASSYWVLFTKDVIPKSGGKSYDAQEQLVASYSQKAQVKYEIPHLLEAAISIFMEHLKAGQMLYSAYSDSSWTSCQERVTGYNTPLIVGDFAMDGLAAILISDFNFLKKFGVAGLRKLSVNPLTPLGSMDSLPKQRLQKPLPPPPIARSKIVQPEIVLEASPPPLSIASTSVLPPVPSEEEELSGLRRWQKKKEEMIAKQTLPPASATSLAPVPSLVPSVLPKTPIKSSLPAIAFGKELWTKYLGDVGEEPPLPSNIQEILQSPCPFNPGKRVQETHLLTLIPKTVNGKPLTLNSLEELVKHPKQGQATEYNYYWDEIKKEFGEKPVLYSSWVLLTRDVIPGSRSKNYETQVQLLKSFCEKAHVLYQIPQVLETAASLFMEYLRTGQRLYTSNSMTFTRCQERAHNNPNLLVAVGGFATSGLYVSNDCGLGSIGLGGMRKF